MEIVEKIRFLFGIPLLGLWLLILPLIFVLFVYDDSGERPQDK